MLIEPKANGARPPFKLRSLTVRAFIITTFLLTGLGTFAYPQE